MLYFYLSLFLIRYNQGVTDIQATSINIVGEPQEVFKEIRRGTVGTKYAFPRINELVNLRLPCIYRGYYTLARRYGFYLRGVKTICKMR